MTSSGLDLVRSEVQAAEDSEHRKRIAELAHQERIELQF